MAPRRCTLPSEPLPEDRKAIDHRGHARYSVRARRRLARRRVRIGEAKAAVAGHPLAQRGREHPGLDVVVVVHLDDMLARCPAQHPADVLARAGHTCTPRGHSAGTTRTELGPSRQTEHPTADTTSSSTQHRCHEADNGREDRSSRPRQRLITPARSTTRGPIGSCRAVRHRRPVSIIKRQLRGSTVPRQPISPRVGTARSSVRRSRPCRSPTPICDSSPATAPSGSRPISTISFASSTPSTTHR